MNAIPEPRSAIRKTTTHTARSVARQVACTARSGDRLPDTSLRLPPRLFAHRHTRHAVTPNSRTRESGAFGFHRKVKDGCKLRG